MDEEKLYDLIDVYRDPPNFGKLEKFDLEEEGYSPSCGDRFKLYLCINDGIIRKASFDGNGCVISTVSASKLCSFVIGKTPSEVKQLTFSDIKKILGIDNISASRVKCATVALEAIKSAVNRAI